MENEKMKKHISIILEDGKAQIQVDKEILPLEMLASLTAALNVAIEMFVKEKNVSNIIPASQMPKGKVQ